jgi:orotidine-5'-phosphate decarboxylase
MAPKLIAALDYNNLSDALELVDTLSERVGCYKVGLELFVSEGPKIVSTLKNHRKKVFLDLKFHDIPNTVFGALRACVRLGIDMTSIHTLGGLEMLKSAVDCVKNESLKAGTCPPLLIGVTVLTSLGKDGLADLDISDDTADYVLRLAKLGAKAGLDGVVSSAAEVPRIKRALGKDFITVAPGIRLKGDNPHDQRRVVTPKEAKELGADYIVLGRPITMSQNPIKSVEAVLAELE